MQALTQAQVRALFSYDPTTGMLSNRVARGSRALVGKSAGWRDKSGYRVLQVDGIFYTATHLIWVYMTGEWVDCQIDHRDQNPRNDRWLNLRKATMSQNMINRVSRSKNTGFRGVRFTPRKTAFQAVIKKDGKTLCLGSYKTAEQAARVYDVAAKKLHGKFAMLNFP